MDIRPARPEEAGTLGAIALASKSHWPYPAAQIEAWRADLAISAEQIVAHPTFVAESNGQIAGFYQLLAQGGSWILEHLWVLPEHMGKGYGRALLEHAAAQAVRGGAHIISIDADPHAEPFYSACGATTVSLKAAPIEGRLDRVRPQMVLDLKAENPIAYIHLPPGSAMPAFPFYEAFKVVVIVEAVVPIGWQYQVSEWLIAAGCRYMMAWGVDCCSWDDSVDWPISKNMIPYQTKTSQ